MTSLQYFMIPNDPEYSEISWKINVSGKEGGDVKEFCELSRKIDILPQIFSVNLNTSKCKETTL